MYQYFIHFLLLNNIPLYEYMIFYLFISQLMDILTVMANASMNPMHKFKCGLMFSIVLGVYKERNYRVIWQFCI